MIEKIRFQSIFRSKLKLNIHFPQIQFEFPITILRTHYVFHFCPFIVWQLFDISRHKVGWDLAFNSTETINLHHYDFFHDFIKNIFHRTLVGGITLQLWYWQFFSAKFSIWWCWTGNKFSYILVYNFIMNLL